MSERSLMYEGRQPSFVDTKPVTRKGKVIFEAKEPVKIPISRENHRQQLLDQRDFFQDRIDKIEEMLAKIDAEIEAGKIVRCFDEGDHLSYETQEKPPLGFPRPQSAQGGSIKDASTWKREQEERGKRS